MKIEEHVYCAIDAMGRGETEHALLHACIAVDASSQKYFSTDSSTRTNYQNFIRRYYWVLEPMIGCGINFDDTKWNNISLKKSNGKEVENKDIAAFIYHAFRCSQAHGNEIQPQYKLLPRNNDGTLLYHISNDQLNLPETIIWGLVAIVVFSKANSDIETESMQFLSLGQNHFSISDWWGLEDSFKPIAQKHNQTRVTIQGLGEFVKSPSKTPTPLILPNVAD